MFHVEVLFSIFSSDIYSLEELKQSIRRHLAQGHIEEAFQVALSANSLSMVLATCEMVNPSLIFNQGGQGAPSCLLPQHVLLALVQQLGKCPGITPNFPQCL